MHHKAKFVLSKLPGMGEDQKSRSGKKRKHVAETEPSESIPPQTSATPPQTDRKPKKPHQPREQDESQSESPRIQNSKEDASQEDPDNALKKQQRFIVFIGAALPFSRPLKAGLTTNRQPTLHLHD